MSPHRQYQGCLRKYLQRPEVSTGSNGMVRFTPIRGYYMQTRKYFKKLSLFSTYF